MDGTDPGGLCTGSRIENDDGTCKGGGFTTQDSVDRHELMQRERTASIAAAVITLARTGKTMAAAEGGGALTGPGEIPNQLLVAAIGVAGAAYACNQGCSAIMSQAIEEVNSLAKAVLHGNSLESTKPTWVYQLVSNRTGTILKFGITGELNPLNRYPAWFYEVGNFTMVPLAKYPTRAPARADERFRCSQYVATYGNLPPLSAGC